MKSETINGWTLSGEGSKTEAECVGGRSYIAIDGDGDLSVGGWAPPDVMVAFLSRAGLLPPAGLPAEVPAGMVRCRAVVVVGHSGQDDWHVPMVNGNSDLEHAIVSCKAAADRASFVTFDAPMPEKSTDIVGEVSDG